MNSVFSKKKKSSNIIKALEKHELPESFDLRSSVDAELLIERLQTSMRIRLSTRVLAELGQVCFSFLLSSLK